MAEPHRDALAPLQARGDPLRAVPYGQGAHCGGLRLLRALQPATSRCALDHRFGPRRRAGAYPKYKQINSEGCKLWVKEESMKPIRVPDLAPEQLTALEDLYRSTRSVRLRTRAQMVLLAAERGLTAREIAEIVRSSEETVRRWLKRYLAEGVEGLSDAPQPGAPRKVTEEYCERLVQAVRRRPRSLGLPFSLWTLRRLADYMAEQTGIRVEYETVRVHLKAVGIVLSRPQHTIASPDTEYALKKRRSKKPATVSGREITSTTLTSST